ncbi:MAG: thiol:disulfide interchange protein DsbD [Gammaproteobacteria bacterium]
MLATFFGFGLLLTFTPCVFPRIPILSSIIIGQGDQIGTRRAFSLSLTYVLAMSFTYTAAGVAAGLLGAGGTYIGVGVMGVLSALIVGPCVAAPLAGALIYIGQTGDAVLGGTALFALSLGMGTPVLIVGTSGGRLLPKVRPWMVPIKAVFGVLLLGVALYLLERIAPEPVTVLLWAVALIVSAVYIGALDSLAATPSGWRRLWKGARIVMAVYGVLLMIGVAARSGGDLFRPLKGLMTGAHIESASLVFKPVRGFNVLQTEVRAAAAQGNPVMLDFYADWCVSCKEL